MLLVSLFVDWSILTCMPKVSLFFGSHVSAKICSCFFAHKSGPLSHRHTNPAMWSTLEPPSPEPTQLPSDDGCAGAAGDQPSPITAAASSLHPAATPFSLSRTPTSHTTEDLPECLRFTPSSSKGPSLAPECPSSSSHPTTFVDDVHSNIKDKVSEPGSSHLSTGCASNQPPSRPSSGHQKHRFMVYACRTHPGRGRHEPPPPLGVTDLR
jgi:hypothetical protein